MPDPDRPAPSEADLTKTVTFTEKDLKDAARLFRLLADPALIGDGSSGGFAHAATSPVEGRGQDRQALMARAWGLINSRRARRRYFQCDIFGEPAWEILLALYATEESGARLTISKLAEWVEAPLTTVIRWVKALEDEGLVGRVAHPTDRRTQFINLLDQGRKALDSYLAAIG